MASKAPQANWHATWEERKTQQSCWLVCARSAFFIEVVSCDLFASDFVDAVQNLFWSQHPNGSFSSKGDVKRERAGVQVVGFFAVAKAEARSTRNAWNVLSCQALATQPAGEREQSAESEALPVISAVTMQKMCLRHPHPKAVSLLAHEFDNVQQIVPSYSGAHRVRR